jgi:phosphoribosylanthranilate isomerase
MSSKGPFLAIAGLVGSGIRRPAAPKASVSKLSLKDIRASHRREWIVRLMAQSVRKSFRVLTQIYEISTPEEAGAISSLGIDHAGVLVGDGQFPRELPLAAAKEVAHAISTPSRFSALFLTANMLMIEAWVRELRPSIVHLGASAHLVSPTDVAELKGRLPGIQIMRSVPVTGQESIAIAQSYDAIADMILLDSYRALDDQIGALGLTHDWSISRRIVEAVRIPVILAGGLGPDNVRDAIGCVRPAGVDSKTKTDRHGSHAKDIELVRRFRQAAVFDDLD